jgi:flagellar protein FlaG
MAISPINNTNPVNDVWLINRNGQPPAAAQTAVAPTAPDSAAKNGAASNNASADKDKGGSALADAEKETGAMVMQEEQIREVLDSINHAFAMMSISVQFTFDPEDTKALKTVIIKVIDRETGKVIREIPPETMSKVVRDMKKLSGLLVQETA